jgi:translation initiation factor IF-2
MKKKENNNLISRPPVVVIMGHVDHGKSSILEAIKDLRITVKESGGITQHIGAYEVEEKGKMITFIDTPGHEAFSAMRMRGAKVADVAILVVAAEEGLKPQTKEAIEHIKKAGIPMIVAINKIDKSTADPEKVKRELIGQDVVVEDMGGKIPSVEVSAKTKKGIDHLLEIISLVSEMEELKADISVPAEGVVIESYLDSSKGPVATIILEKGIIKRGDFIGTNSVFGKAKGLENFLGKAIDSASPSVPVLILGFENVPAVGETIRGYKSQDEWSSYAKASKDEKKIEPEVIEIKEGQKVVNILLKSDVFGSLEAISEVLKTLPQDKAVLRILKAEVGDVNDTDVKLAKAANAKLICFRVKATSSAIKLAERDKVTIINFSIIYEIAQAVRNLLEKSLGSETSRTDLGKVKILAFYKSEKGRQVIGGKVIGGVVRRGAFAEIMRNEEIMGKGKIVSLQKDKKEAAEVDKRNECGMLFEGDAKIEEGDILNVYIEERKKAEL